MLLLLDTSTPVCKLTFIEGDWRYDNEWSAGRSLARDLLAYLQEQLSINGKSWSSISGLGVLAGPGSFTGLRIGITVLNTIADSENIAIVGALGTDWQIEAVKRLRGGENDKLVLPVYGSEAHITQPRK